MTSKQNNDIHIKILKWAKEKGTFKLQEILDAFPEHQGVIEMEVRYSKIFNTKGLHSDEYFISFDDRFKLLEYEELEEARKSSKQAMLAAIISIVLTFFALAITIYSNFFYSQDVVSTEIDSNILNNIIEFLGG